MGKEKGSILITVIFLMVILLIIAIGMSSIGSGGLEDSIIAAGDISNTQNKESVAASIQTGTNIVTGADNWITDTAFAGDVVGKDRLIMRVFIEKEDNKTFSFTLPSDMLTPSAVYVVGIPGTGVTLSSFTGPVPFVSSAATTGAIGYKSSAPAQGGNYSFMVDNTFGGEYTVFVRVFCNQ